MKRFGRPPLRDRVAEGVVGLGFEALAYIGVAYGAARRVVEELVAEQSRPSPAERLSPVLPAAMIVSGALAAEQTVLLDPQNGPVKG
jgi:hypothetical protein